MLFHMYHQGLRSKQGRWRQWGKSGLKVKRAVLHGCYRKFSTIQKDIESARPKEKASGRDKSSKLKGLFKHIGLRGMLEGKKYWAVDMVFTFLVGSIDRAIAVVEKTPMTKLDTMYLDLIRPVTKYRSHGDSHSTHLKEFRERELEVLGNRLWKKWLIVVVRMGRIFWNVLLDHLVEDLERAGNTVPFDALWLERFHVYFKRE